MEREELTFFPLRTLDSFLALLVVQMTEGWKLQIKLSINPFSEKILCIPVKMGMI